MAVDRIDGIVEGVSYKAPVRSVSTTEITLSGLQTVGGIDLVGGDRVLVMHQSDAKKNGIYVVSATAWSRALDFNGQRDAVFGTLVSLASANLDLRTFRLTSPNPVIFETSDITFAEVDGFWADAPAGAPELDDKLIFRDVSDSENKSVTLAGLVSSINDEMPFHTITSVGLAADGVTDDSARLQGFMEVRPDGGLFLGDPAKNIYIGNTLKIPSRWTVSGCSFLASKTATVRICGHMAETPSENHFHLLTDVNAGEIWIPIETSPQGGGAVSSLWAVGDFPVIRGLSDGSGNSITSDEPGSVVEIDDAGRRIRVSKALESAYSPTYPAGDYEAAFGEVDRTYITKKTAALITADVSEGEFTVTLDPAQAGQLGRGDFVLLEDDEETVSGQRLNVEPQYIADISGATVTLATPSARDLAVANTARLTKFIPARRASIIGCSIQYVEAADPSPAERTHAFEMNLAVDCQIADCEVPNIGVFGNRGNAFRIRHSFSCHGTRNTCRGAKHVGSGDGYAGTIYYSNKSSHVHQTSSGMRHDCLFQGASNSMFGSPRVTDPRLSPLDFHGCGESNCWVFDAEIIGGSRLTQSTLTALKSGNPTHRGFTRDCGIDGLTVKDWTVPGATVLRFDPGTDGFVARNITVKGCDKFLIHRQADSEPSLLTKRVRIEGARVEDVRTWTVDVQGGTSKTMDGLEISNSTFEKCYRLMQIQDARVVELDDVRIVEPVQDGNQYAVDALRVTRLRIRQNSWVGAKKGLRANACPDLRWITSTISDQEGSNTMVFFDEGGNDGGIVDVRAFGFVPTKDVGAGSLITFSGNQLS